MLKKILTLAIFAALPFAMVQAKEKRRTPVAAPAYHHDSGQELHVISVKNNGEAGSQLTLTPAYQPLLFPDLLVQFGNKDKRLPIRSEFQLIGGTYEVTFVGVFQMTELPLASAVPETVQVNFVLNRSGSQVYPIQPAKQTFESDIAGSFITVTLSAIFPVHKNDILEVVALDASNLGTLAGTVVTISSNLKIERINEKRSD